jgi:hypothetical protein
VDGAVVGTRVADGGDAGSSAVFAGSVTGGQQGMATDLDRFVEELQQEIIEQARAVYPDKVIEEFYNPKNLGRMSEPDARGIAQGRCGETMEIYLRLNGDRIEETSFVTDTVIIAMGLHADRSLTNALADQPEVYTISDCVEPREVLDAIYEGVEVGRTV